MTENELRKRMWIGLIGMIFCLGATFYTGFYFEMFDSKIEYFKNWRQLVPLLFIALGLFSYGAIFSIKQGFKYFVVFLAIFAAAYTLGYFLNT